MNAETGRIDDSWRQLVDLVGGMDDITLRAPGPDGWAIKDHLAHVGAWERSLLALLAGRDRLEAMGVSHGPDVEIDQVNDAVFNAHRRQSVDEVRRYAADTHAQLMAALNELSDADLQRPYSFYQPGDPDEMRPVVGWVAGNTYDHYAEHIGWIQEQTAAKG